MFLKKCPFCNQPAESMYEKSDYVISCKSCKNKGIDVKVVSKTMKEAQNLWNTRVFDEQLLKNPEDTIRVLQICSNGDKQDCDLDIDFDPYELSKFGYGYLITEDSIIECDDSHREELLKYFGMESDNIDFDYESACIECGIIRICLEDNCLMVVLPKKYNKKQIDMVMEVLYNKEISNRRMFVYENMFGEEKITEMKTLNELLLYIDRK